jgi:hypothetical protein
MHPSKRARSDAPMAESVSAKRVGGVDPEQPPEGAHGVPTLGTSQAALRTGVATGRTASTVAGSERQRAVCSGRQVRCEREGTRGEAAEPGRVASRSNVGTPRTRILDHRARWRGGCITLTGG